MRWIGIDLGSSSIKGAVLDVGTGTLGEPVRIDFPSAIAGLRAGHFEVDPKQVIDAAGTVLRQLLSQAPECAGVLWCSQMGGVILVDGAGRALSNYLSWRDQRTTLSDSPAGGSCIERVTEKLGPERLTEIGRESKPGAMLNLLAWLRERGRLPLGAVPLGLGEFVVSQLTGSPPVVEPTSALGTMNLATRDWHRDAFAALELSDLKLPRLAPYTEVAGRFSWNGREVSFYPAVGDHQAALAGAQLEPGELSLNVSTGSQVSRLTEGWDPGDYQTRPYFGGRFLNTITHVPAGRSLQVLMDLLTELPRAAGVSLADPWEQVITLAESAPDSDLEVDLAFFADPFGSEGSISGITTENLSAGTLFRAAFRNMAKNCARCASCLFPNRDWTSVVFSGGLVQKTALLRERIATRLGANAIRIAASDEDTLAGLLALATQLS